MVVQEIQSTNVSKVNSVNGSKANTPKPQQISTLKPSSRSFSTEVGDATMMRLSPRDTPSRKYFDSGDYEMARAGILSSASVGSIHACPEKLMSSGSRSGSSHHFSQDEMNSFGLKNQSAPNTGLQKSIFSMSSLEE